MSEQWQSTLTLSDLAGLIKEQLASRSLVVAVDGCGGSGKSHFAKVLAENLTDIGPVKTVHFDDFYKPSIQRLPQRECEALIGSDFDWQRLKREILVPLSRGDNAVYQRYDWDKDCLDDWHTIPAYGLTIVEGIYSTRFELASFYNLTCWVYCCRDQRLERGIERDGEAKRELWERYWMPAEDRYVELEEPHKRAKILIDGSGCSSNLSIRCPMSSLFVAS